MSLVTNEDEDSDVFARHLHLLFSEVSAQAFRPPKILFSSLQSLICKSAVWPCDSPPLSPSTAPWRPWSKAHARGQAGKALEWLGSDRRLPSVGAERFSLSSHSFPSSLSLWGCIHLLIHTLLSATSQLRLVL